MNEDSSFHLNALDIAVAKSTVPPFDPKPLTTSYGHTILEDWIELSASWNIRG